MNYKLIHDKIINYIRATPIRDRIKRRNPNDSRLTGRIYVEIHHIIPRSLNGNDEPANLVEVLPEEHLFLHMLRYKIYKKREDALAIRFMLNGFENSRSKNLKFILNKKIRAGYSWIRSHAQHIRENQGWHTDDGVRRISEARKGKMPVKDALSGMMIGMVNVDHPNVISKKWVHHSKGVKQSEEKIRWLRAHNLGQNNPNASGLSDEYFIEKGIEMFNEFGHILSWGYMLKLSKLRNFKWIKSLRSRFNGNGAEGYYSILEEKTGSKYIKFKRYTLE